MLNLDSFRGLWQDFLTPYLDRNSTLRLIASTVFTFLLLVPIYRSRSRRSLPSSRTPRLQGPRSESFIFGATKKIFPSANLSLVYRDWDRMYGPVYEIPTGIGSSHRTIVFCDPKALSHIFSKDTTTYHVLPGISAVSKKVFGDVVAAIEGETHKRLRRALSPPLSVSAVRSLTHVCLDSAYQLKAAWNTCSDTCSQSSDKSNLAIVIDVDKWMNFITLDTTGKAILSHDFGTLMGHTSLIMAAFDSIHTIKPSLFLRLVYFFAPILYAFFKITFTSVREQKLAQSVTHLNALTTDILRKARKAQPVEDIDVGESVLGILAKSENANPNVRLSLAEITTQANFLFMAAYETTAITLTWSLIELARRPEIQETLRAELTDCLAEGERPTYDHLTKDLKYLDAFVAEILRLHAPEMQSTRMAAEDDVVPLTDPIRTAAGEMIDSLFVKKGTVVRVPLGGVNMLEALWGPDAGTFNPDRWLQDQCEKIGRREELPGYRGLLTFGAGPRMCPGRDLAVLEVKAVLSVLVRHFAFEFPNGPSTELTWHFTRPKVASEDGTKVPLRVRRLTL